LVFDLLVAGIELLGHSVDLSAEVTDLGGEAVDKYA